MTAMKRSERISMQLYSHRKRKSFKNCSAAVVNKAMKLKSKNVLYKTLYLITSVAIEH